MRQHKTLLGCLTCSASEKDSVFSETGPFGTRVEAQSIYNRAGNFGAVFSNDSPCNVSAANPPVVLDDEGHFYGMLTLNQSLQPTTVPGLIDWLSSACSRR